MARRMESSASARCLPTSSRLRNRDQNKAILSSGAECWVMGLMGSIFSRPMNNVARLCRQEKLLYPTAQIGKTLLSKSLSWIYI